MDLCVACGHVPNAAMRFHCAHRCHLTALALAQYPEPPEPSGRTSGAVIVRLVIRPTTPPSTATARGVNHGAILSEYPDARTGPTTAGPSPRRRRERA
jgi:hypothetical protein